MPSAPLIRITACGELVDRNQVIGIRLVLGAPLFRGRRVGKSISNPITTLAQSVGCCRVNRMH
jgi:hypothetical protein